MIEYDQFDLGRNLNNQLNPYFNFLFTIAYIPYLVFVDPGPRNLPLICSVLVARICLHQTTHGMRRRMDMGERGWNMGGTWVGT